MTETRAASAMQVAQDALNRVNTHEEVCGLRYAAIDGALNELKGWLKWGGSIAFLTIVGLLSWSLNNQFTAIQQKGANDAARIATLEQQLGRERQTPPTVTVVN